MGLSLEKGHIAGLENFLLNMSLVVTLGLFAGLALRSLLLLVFDPGRSNRVVLLRSAAAVGFFVFGSFYFIFANNMMILDRPPRAALAVISIAFPLLAFARIRKGTVKPPSTCHAASVGAVLIALCVMGMLTLLRAGTVPLTGDRVTLTVEVTGEEMGGTSASESGPNEGRTALHHVIVWLPSGEHLFDVWLPADRLRIEGRIYRLSKGLNDLGVPNLYEFVSVEGATGDPNGAERTVRGDLPLLARGSLGVHPWWRPIQLWLLSCWESRTDDGSFFALRTEPDASPFYPLVDGQGHVVRKTFLLVLPPSGHATSRGSSPLEKNVPVSF